jgi:hypothetical protein
VDIDIVFGAMAMDVAAMLRQFTEVENKYNY